MSIASLYIATITYTDSNSWVSRRMDREGPVHGSKPRILQNSSSATRTITLFFFFFYGFLSHENLQTRRERMDGIMDGWMDGCRGGVI